MATGQRRNRLRPVLHALVATAALAGAGAVAVPSPAVAQGACQTDLPREDTIDETPWEEAVFGLDRLPGAPTGAGVRVAVIDSGVEASHAQLDDGQVAAGADFVPEGGTDGRIDCAGHGTQVASLIAASDEAPDIGFAGLAPGVTILPARITERDFRGLSVSLVAEAIVWATDQGADIINLSLFFTGPDDGLADAVQYALDNDVIVVAAVSENTGSGQDEFDPVRPSFPAAYPGVVGVSAIGPAGLRMGETHAGSDTDLLAPGEAVTAAWAGGGHVVVGGTSFAAPFVSAAAALVLHANPDLTATEVVDLLRATADPAPRQSSEQNNAGIVNPYRALTGRVAEGEPVAVPPPAEPAVDPVAQARAERWERSVQRALLIVLVAGSVTALGFIGAGIWRRGQRRRWLPVKHREPVFPRPAADEPERLFYTVPTPRSRR